MKHIGENAYLQYFRHERIRTVPIRSVHTGNVPETVQRKRSGNHSGGINTQRRGKKKDDPNDKNDLPNSRILVLDAYLLPRRHYLFLRHRFAQADLLAILTLPLTTFNFYSLFAWLFSNSLTRFSNSATD